MLLNLDVVARSEGPVFRMLFSPAMGYLKISWWGVNFSVFEMFTCPIAPSLFLLGGVNHARRVLDTTDGRIHSWQARTFIRLISISC